MTDKELLELAAKAAGMQIFVWGKKGSENYCIKNNDGTPGNRWNPLTDDGDALRLAVKLKIDVIRDFDRVIACYGDDEFETEYFYETPTPTDPYAATRRAITRAAAEIGKAML
jgi:hypothetical protein